jgi:hypothetical protein
MLPVKSQAVSTEATVLAEMLLQISSHSEESPVKAPLLSNKQLRL